MASELSMLQETHEGLSAFPIAKELKIKQLLSIPTARIVAFLVRNPWEMYF